MLIPYFYKRRSSHFFIALLFITCHLKSHAHEITADTIDRERQNLKKYIEGTKENFNWAKDSWFIGYNGMVKWEGLNNIAGQTIPIAEKYFSPANTQKRNLAIENLGTPRDLEMINVIITEHNNNSTSYKSRSDKKNALAMIMHTNHIDAALPSLSESEKQKYKSVPAEYIKLLNNGSVSEPEYFRCLTLGMFVRFWQESRGRL
jgi:hypothetical protein